MKFFDENGQEIVNPVHGQHALDANGNEYVFSGCGEGWMPLEDFDKKYAGGPYPLG